MIRVELRTWGPYADPGVAAELTVHDDGSHSLRGDRSVIDLERTMFAPGRRRVRFGEDPAMWARLLPENIHSPVHYAIVVEDSTQ